MAKLFVQMSISLDGFIEGPDGAMDWFAGDKAFDEILTATVRGIDGMVFGRKAYELGAAYWPTAGEAAETPEVVEQIALMNRLPKYVLTHGQEDANWENSHFVSTDHIPQLKAEASRPLALFAGAQAAQTALASGLVDQLRLIQYPIILGGGTPLFAVATEPLALVQTDSHSFVGGPTVTRYSLTQ